MQDGRTTRESDNYKAVPLHASTTLIPEIVQRMCGGIYVSFWHFFQIKIKAIVSVNTTMRHAFLLLWAYVTVLSAAKPPGPDDKAPVSNGGFEAKTSKSQFACVL